LPMQNYFGCTKMEETTPPQRRRSHANGNYKTTILVTPMKESQKNPPVLFDLTQENAFSPTPDAPRKKTNSSNSSPFPETESKLASQSKNSIETEPLISTPTSSSTENWILQIQDASICLREMASKMNLEIPLSSDSIPISREQAVQKTFIELMSTCAKMASVLRSLPVKQTSIDSLRIFAKCTEIASHGFPIVEAALKELLYGQLQAQEALPSETQNTQENKETSGSMVKRMQVKPPGLKRKCTVTVTTRSATPAIPSTTTQRNKSLFMMTSSPAQGTSSCWETCPTIQDHAPETQDTTKDSYRRALPSGRSSAPTNPSTKNTKKNQ